jgi:hypothetical protein
VAEPGIEILRTRRQEEQVDQQIAEMRDLLRLMRGASATESLRALRSAFPETTLAARTAAVADRRL